MDDLIKKAEQTMNDYLVSNKFQDNIIYDNLLIFYMLGEILEEVLKKKLNYLKEEIDFSKISKLPLFDKIKIVEQFYNDHNIEFDLNKHIKDGTINFLYYDPFAPIAERKNRYSTFRKGSNYYNEGKKLIDVCNNGFITDIFVFVHELSHLRNQPNNGRNQISHLLTETLAYTDELICLDYLKKLGYEEDVVVWKKRMFYLFYVNNFDAMNIYKMMILYKELGSLSKESYKLFYKETKNYENLIKYISQYNDKDYKLYYKSWYVMSSILSVYLYDQYKENPKFLKNILKLYENINNSSMEECLKLMNLKDFGKEDRLKLHKSLENIIGDIEKVSRRRR